MRWWILSRKGRCTTSSVRSALVARPDFSVVLDRGGGTYERVSVEVLHEAGETTRVRGKITTGDTVVLYPPSGLGGEG